MLRTVPESIRHWRSQDRVLVAAVHPINAVMIFLVSGLAVKQTWAQIATGQFLSR